MSRIPVLMAGLALGMASFVQAGETPPATYSAEASRLVSTPDEIICTLDNGLTVIAKRVVSPAVSVRCYVRTGGIYEGRWLGTGVSHLLEHLVAGGTTERRTEAQNRDLLQQIGNDSNAFTSFDQTAYFVNTTPDNLDKAVDLVAGWVFGAKITPEEFAREYQVVQRELERGKGEPDRLFYYDALRNRFTVSPARVPVIGYQAAIQGLTRDQVYEYYRLAYQPGNMVFAIAGDIDPAVILKAVQKHANVPPGRAFSHDIPEEPAVLAPRTVVSAFPKLGQAKLELAFPSIRLSHEDLYALDLLATILGQGESSILVQELRDRQNLASSVVAWSWTPHFVQGTFAIDMELDADKVPQATAAALAQIERIRKEGVSEDRLRRAKVQTKTARAFATQSAADLAESMATDLMSTGDPHFSDRYVERMQAVTAAQVQAMAVKYLDPARLLTTAMLPEEALGEGGLSAAEAMLRSATPAATTRPAVTGDATIESHPLGDGGTLLLKRVPTAPIVVLRMYAVGGLTAEDEKTNGLGALAMEAARRGTATRSAAQIAEFFDSIGGQMTTASGNNTWGWSAACLKEDLGKTLEVFADIVKNPTFPDDQVQLVKRRQLAIIEGQDADHFAESFRFFRKAYFGPRKSPYQFTSTGTKETVEGFTAGQAKQWYQQKVLKAPRVLAIFGDIDLAQARALAEAQFGAGKAEASPARTLPQHGAPAPAGKPTIAVSRVEINRSANPQAGVFVGFDSDSFVGDPANDPLTVADTMASGYAYPTGYLFETLRGQGLVYDVQAFNFPGKDASTPGAFIVYASCSPKDVDAVINGILENMARLQGKPEDLRVEWFERSKRLIVTSDAVEHETAAEQAQTAALDVVLGLGYMHHASFARRINAVTLPQVQEVSRRLLRRCVVTVNTSEPAAVTTKAGERTYDSFKPVDLTPKGVTHEQGVGR